MKLLFALLLLLSLQNAIAQEKPVKAILDSNISITFAQTPETLHQKDIKVFKVDADTSIYQVVINYATPLKVKTKEDFDIATKGIIDGINKNSFIDSFSQTVVDTVIAHVPGKYITLYSAKGMNGIYEVVNFITILDTYTYMVSFMAGTKDKLKSDSLKRNFYNSVKFNGKPYTDGEDYSKAAELGRMTGKFVVGALVVLGIVAIRNYAKRQPKLGQ
jgi:hypothetical protein